MSGVVLRLHPGAPAPIPPRPGPLTPTKPRGGPA